MKNNNFLQIILLVLLCILTAANLFIKPGNLKDSQKILQNVQGELETSKKLLENQSETILELRKLNEELFIKVNRIDSMNSLIRKNIDVNIGKANRSINEIKQTIENIKPLNIQ